MTEKVQRQRIYKLGIIVKTENGVETFQPIDYLMKPNAQDVNENNVAAVGFSKVMKEPFIYPDPEGDISHERLNEQGFSDARIEELIAEGNLHLQKRKFRETKAVAKNVGS